MKATTVSDVENPCDRVAPPQVGVRSIGLNELRDKLDGSSDFLFVMAMDQRRFDTAHIAGSISFDRLTEMLPTLDKATEIVVYCTDAACAASKLRAAHLVEFGFTNVFRLRGGLAEWVEAGLPLVEAIRPAA